MDIQSIEDTSPPVNSSKNNILVVIFIVGVSLLLIGIVFLSRLVTKTHTNTASKAAEQPQGAAITVSGKLVMLHGHVGSNFNSDANEVERYYIQDSTTHTLIPLQINNLNKRGLPVGSIVQISGNIASTNLNNGVIVDASIPTSIHLNTFIGITPMPTGVQNVIAINAYFTSYPTPIVQPSQIQAAFNFTDQVYRNNSNNKSTINVYPDLSPIAINGLNQPPCSDFGVIGGEISPIPTGGPTLDPNGCIHNPAFNQIINGMLEAFYNRHPDIDFSVYNHIFYFISSPYYSAGYSFLDGGLEYPGNYPHNPITIRQSFGFISSPVTDQGLLNSLVVHEYGHSIGFNHPNYLWCDNGAMSSSSNQSQGILACQSMEYGDPPGTLGGGKGAVWNALYKDHAGWFDPANITTVTQPHKYTLYPLETNGQILNHSLIALKIPRFNVVYVEDPTAIEPNNMYLEFRQPYDYDARPKVNVGLCDPGGAPNLCNGALIHIPGFGLYGNGYSEIINPNPPNPQPTPDNTDAVLNQCQTMRDPYTNTEIFVSQVVKNQSHPELSHLDVYVNPGPTITPQMYDFTGPYGEPPLPQPTLTPMPWPGSTFCTNAFHDTSSQDVLDLACRNIISGHACGGANEACDAQHRPYFEPTSNVTRGQLAKFLVNAAGYSDIIPPNQQTFTDVPPNYTFHDAIETVAAHGVISGNVCGGANEPCDGVQIQNSSCYNSSHRGRCYFRPNNNVTRGQAAKMISLAANISPNNVTQVLTYHDVPVGSTYYAFVSGILDHQEINNVQLFQTYACGGIGEACDANHLSYFRPSQPATRDMIATAVEQAFFPNCYIANPPHF